MGAQLIHIALTFNDGFWAPAYATMRGICALTHRRADLVFHLIHTGLTHHHRAELDAITSEFGARLIDHDLDKTDILTTRIAQLPPMPHRRLHPIVYARLFLPEIVGPGIDRIVYLDCDMMVRVPIERLADIELEGHPIAAAICPYRTGFQTERDLKPRLGFDTADPYFNAGMMVIDTKAWAGLDVIGTLKQSLSKDQIASLFLDQDTLNVVLKNRWKVLDHRWNLQNPSVLDEPHDPFIVHYTGPNKPWNLMGRTAYKRIYRHMMTNRIYYAFWRERVRARLPGLLKGLVPK